MIPNTSTDTASREIVITRQITAPRDLVFQTWTDPKHVSQWWGPRTFTTPICDIELKVGGTWRYVMRSPNGEDYPVLNVYLEIVPPERLVYQTEVEPNDIWQNGAPAKSLNTILFEEEAGGTKLTIRSVFENVADRDKTAQMGYREGMTESLERLEELLAGW